ncbi:MAG: hypothetical protein M3Q19_12855 [Pseudomonadota bacterium]|nr:hypothetical protein [Pseudomonadota bacterium]
MMRSLFAAAAAACLGMAAPAAAQPAGSDSGVATLGWYGVQASFRDDPSVEGGKALRVVVAGKGANPWDGGVGAKVERAVRAGDEVILTFWARLEQGVSGEALATLPASVGLNAAPWTSVASEPVDIGPKWKRYEVRGKADRDYAAGTLGVGFQVATASRTIDFGPVATVPAGGAAKATTSAAARAPAKPQVDVASMIINDPSAPQVNGAKAKLRDDPAVQGGKALRIPVAAKSQNAWEVSIASAVTKPIKAGDELLLAFWARLEKGEAGPTTTLPYAAIQMSSEPWTTVMAGSADIGPEWKLHEIRGKTDKDYTANSVGVTIQLATAKQTIDFGPIMVLNLGQ